MGRLKKDEVRRNTLKVQKRGKTLPESGMKVLKWKATQLASGQQLPLKKTGKLSDESKSKGGVSQRSGTQVPKGESVDQPQNLRSRVGNSPRSNVNKSVWGQASAKTVVMDNSQTEEQDEPAEDDEFMDDRVKLTVEAHEDDLGDEEVESEDGEESDGSLDEEEDDERDEANPSFGNVFKNMIKEGVAEEWRNSGTRMNDKVKVIQKWFPGKHQ